MEEGFKIKLVLRTLRVSDYEFSRKQRVLKYSREFYNTNRSFPEFRYLSYPEMNVSRIQRDIRSIKNPRVQRYPEYKESQNTEISKVKRVPEYRDIQSKKSPRIQIYPN